MPLQYAPAAGGLQLVGRVTATAHDEAQAVLVRLAINVPDSPLADAQKNTLEIKSGDLHLPCFSESDVSIETVTQAMGRSQTEASEREGKAVSTLPMAAQRQSSPTGVSCSGYARQLPSAMKTHFGAACWTSKAMRWRGDHLPVTNPTLRKGWTITLATLS